MSDDSGTRDRSNAFIPPVGLSAGPKPDGMHPSQSGLLFGARGRVIADEVEANDIMSHAYGLGAQQMTDAAVAHRALSRQVTGLPGRSVIRDQADLLYRAGTMDTNTTMRPHLTDQSGNRALRNLPYAEGGGFTAFENVTPIPPTKKNPLGGTTTDQRNIEFHPPGGLHTGGVHTDDHGSYLRPANQLNQKKSLLRSFSSGALTELNKK
jgi:hypothetical protein